MNKETGEIINAEVWEKMRQELSSAELDKYAPMNVEPNEAQLQRGIVGKYDPCPCGSGKKFKWCCWTGKKSELREQNP